LQTPATPNGGTFTAAERRANLAVGRLLRLGVDATDEDRNAVVTLLVEQGGMTQEQAVQTVQRWEQTYQEATARAEEIAREVGQRAADALSALAGVAFIAMVVGAFAGGAGGLVGSPTAKMLPTVETDKEVLRRSA
jgi:polyhydroxyalkanoate synthesis regulator phasin